jgi:hypothetical protein
MLKVQSINVFFRCSVWHVIFESWLSIHFRTEFLFCSRWVPHAIAVLLQCIVIWTPEKMNFHNIIQVGAGSTVSPKKSLSRALTSWLESRKPTSTSHGTPTTSPTDMGGGSNVAGYEAIPRCGENSVWSIVAGTIWHCSNIVLNYLSLFVAPSTKLRPLPLPTEPPPIHVLRV